MINFEDNKVGSTIISKMIPSQFKEMQFYTKVQYPLHTRPMPIQESK